MKEELLKGLTEEQIAKIKACKDQEEVLKFAKEEGIELTDEQLEAVSGGACTSYDRCTKCGSDNLDREPIAFGSHYHCNNCGHWWNHSLFSD